MTTTNVETSPVQSAQTSIALVALLPWERQWATAVGEARHQINLTRRDASWYDARRMEDNRTASIAAAIAELAVAKHVNQYWSASVWPVEDHKLYKDLPDVGTNIEVRTVRTSAAAAVRKHQTGKGLILCVAKPVRPDFGSVELWGWIPMDDAWDLGTSARYDSSGRTRVIDRKYLNTEWSQI